MRIYKYTNDNFTDPVLVTDLTIGKSSTDSDRYRYYLITFKGNEFTKRLVQTSAA